MESNINNTITNMDGAKAHEELMVQGQGKNSCASTEATKEHIWEGDHKKEARIQLCRVDDGNISSEYSKGSSKSSRKSTAAQRRSARELAREKERTKNLAKKRGMTETEYETDTEIDTTSQISEDGKKQGESVATTTELLDEEFPALPVKTPSQEQKQAAAIEGEEILPKLPAKRKIGRKATTGDHYRKQARDAEEERKRDARHEREVLDPLFQPSRGKSYKEFVETIQDKGEEFQNAPIQDLEALAAGRALDIYKVAVHSGNLKGSFAKQIKDAAADMCAATTALALKAQNPVGIPVERQLEDMRREMQSLRMENLKLRQEVEQLKKRKERNMLHQERKNNNEKEPLGVEEENAIIRTRRWVEGNPLPPKGGEIPPTQKEVGEAPLPPYGGEASQAEDIEMLEIPLPPQDGGTSNISEIKRRMLEEWEEERMEVVEEEEFLALPKLGKSPPPSTTKGRKQAPMEMLHVTKGGLEFTIPQGNKEEEVKEREKQMAMIAMFEGIVVRLLDERLGCPIPTYGETKRAEKEGKMAQAKERPQHPQQQKQRQQQPREKPPPITATKKVMAAEKEKKAKAKPIIKEVKVLRSADKKPATTLNPPARPATERITSTGAIKEREEKKQLPLRERKEKVPPAQKLKGEKPQTQGKGKEPNKDGLLWSEVVSRRTKKANTKIAETEAAKNKKAADKKRAQGAPSSAGKGNQTRTNIKRREPRTAAVTVTCPPGTYEKHLREARQKVDEKGLLEGAKIRRGATGSYVFEIPGTGCQERADKFALGMREALKGKEGVRVQRPVKMAELRLRGLDESIQPPEILKAIANAGGCEEEEVHLGEMRKTPSGMGIVWARCPLKAANRIMQSAQIKIGWALVRVELLEARPLQCFKCLEGGHVRARCPSNIDRSGKCYRCGEEGHTAKRCTAAVKCPVCADKGLPANHRTGSRTCMPVHKGKRGIPLNKATNPPLPASEASAKQAKKKPQQQEEASPLIISEEPKEQRVPRTRGGKRAEEKLPTEGDAKRKRLKEKINVTDKDPSDMEVERPEEAYTDGDEL